MWDGIRIRVYANAGPRSLLVLAFWFLVLGVLLPSSLHLTRKTLRPNQGSGGSEEMQINELAFDIITRNEEFRAEPYTDSGGVWTIGYGHTRSKIMPTKVSHEEALELLRTDVEYFEDRVLDLVTVPLNGNQFGALVSLTFNVGEGNLRKSTLLRKLNKGDYDGAAKEFQKWRKAGGKVLRGLVKRRAYEEQLFRSPPPKTTGIDPMPAAQFVAAVRAIPDELLATALAETAVIVVSNNTQVFVPEPKGVANDDGDGGDTDRDS